VATREPAGEAPTRPWTALLGGAGRVATVALPLAGAALVTWAIVRGWDRTEAALGNADVRWLVATEAAACAAMVLIAVLWRSAMGVLGAALAPVETAALYFKGEVAKYVPGSVWAVVGRAELARRHGLSPSAAYGSVVLSLGALFLACAAVAAGGLPFTSGTVGSPPAWALILVVVAGLAALHPAVLGRVWERAAKRWPVSAERPPPTPTWAASLGLVARYMPAWLLVSVATWCASRALTPHPGWANTVSATTVSWLAGFVAVPAPGGIGVREAAFVAASNLPAGVAAAVAVVCRLAFMAADGGGAAVGALVARRRGRDQLTVTMPFKPPV
jgi:uncharacterized membrane protein YbhN (UPF0104 family)